jgi:PAS domain S-box-containing protein
MAEDRRRLKLIQGAVDVLLSLCTRGFGSAGIVVGAGEARALRNGCCPALSLPARVVILLEEPQSAPFEEFPSMDRVPPAEPARDAGAQGAPHARLTVEESEARLRALVEASPLGIVVMDTHGKPISYNPMCEALHGIEFSEAAGDGWEKALHPEDRERVAASWYAAAREGRSWSDTYRFRHSDGRAVWVIGRAAPMYVRGEHVGFVGTLEDITALKETQLEREKLLERAEAGREKAENAARLREQTLAAVAHELRNPLQTIAIAVETLLYSAAGGMDVTDQRPPDRHRPDQDRQLEIMQRTVNRMGRLIRDLLDMSRMEAGTLELRYEPLSISVLIEEVLEIFGRAAAEGEVRFECDIANDTPAVRGDRERLAQVLSNLVDNAIKFTPRGGRIVLCARCFELGVRVSIEDSGPGVPEDMRLRVFDFFWQADRASRVGAGLGLAIAKGIIDAHGGRIWVEGDGGAKFCFTLPFA